MSAHSCSQPAPSASDVLAYETERTALREDRVVAGCEPEEALAAAPASRDGGFSVPKVLEVDP